VVCGSLSCGGSQDKFDDAKGVIKTRNFGQKTQWPKEKRQKDKQRFTKYFTEN
jgi:hypothetical protein